MEIIFKAAIEQEFGPGKASINLLLDKLLKEHGQEMIMWKE